MTFQKSALAVAFASALALNVGCGEKLPEIGQVEGVVTVKNQPKSGIAVMFYPDPAKGNDLPINSSAVTDDSGKYVLHYSHKGMEGDGAPVGWHRVVLQDTRLGAIPQGAPVPPALFPVQYSVPTETPLSYEVKTGPQTIDIEVP